MRHEIPMNLQFFAEELPKEETKVEETKEENPTEKVEETPKEEKPKEDEPSVQQLMIEMAKLKRAVDKASSEAADYKKKWRETLSEQEQASMEKAEAEAARQEKYAAMERQLKINDYTENFMALGYSRDLAKQAAAAQYDGDTESLFKIQSEVQEQLIKAKEAEWIASRPQLQSGGEPKEEDDPFIKGFKSVKQFH